MKNKFNFFSYVNYYGNLMFGICGVNAMPAKKVIILFTGSMEDCKRHYDAYQKEFSTNKYAKDVNDLR